MLGINLAVERGLSFGKECIFTYGPLSFLSSRQICFQNKSTLLAFDIFMVSNLIAVYYALLKQNKGALGYGLCLASVVVIKNSLSEASTSVLFTLLLFWLLMIWERATPLRCLAACVIALLLFFIKVNYGLIAVTALITSIGGAVALGRISAKTAIRIIILFLVGLLTMGWLFHVNIAQYIKGGINLIAGYKQAMKSPIQMCAATFWAAMIELLMFLGIILINFRAIWTNRVVALGVGFLGLDAWLKFQNGFTRFDPAHSMWFHLTLPLTFIIFLCFDWSAAVKGMRFLLAFSLLFTWSTLVAQKQAYFGRWYLSRVLPLSYVKSLSAKELRSTKEVQSYLSAKYPKFVLPEHLKRMIGKAKVDVMPWELSLALLNGFNLASRPVIQSYSAYTEYLDGLNARFFLSPRAPDFILFHSNEGHPPEHPLGADGYPEDHFALERRVPFWDESITRRVILQNYRLADRVDWSARLDDPYEAPSHLLVLKKDAGVRRLIPVQTNAIEMVLGQFYNLKSTTNLIYLFLEADASMLGRLKALAFKDPTVDVAFRYKGGREITWTAIPLIMKTGVLVNRRVETIEDLAALFASGTKDLVAIQGIKLNVSEPWCFRRRFKGQLVEMRMISAQRE
jgi:hypothetical protein